MEMENDNQFGYDVQDEAVEPQEDGSLEQEEELPDSLPEESMADYPEEEPEEPEEEKPKKRDKAQTRINQIQREKYQALHEADRLRQENSRLKEMYDLSAKAAMSQTEKNVLSRLEQARRLKVEANESGDASSMADADMELADSVAALREHNHLKMQQEFYEKQQLEQQQYQQQAEQEPYNGFQHEVQSWLQDNDWINPQSQSFDREKAQAIDGWTAQLNEALVQQGYGHTIGSPAYLQQVEEQAEVFDNYRRQNQYQRRDLNMKPNRGGASPTRSSNAGQATQSRTQQLTTDERDMARRMGVTDKVMLQHVMRDKQMNAHKRRGG